jgi:Ca2+-binding RTX toxin-like protein
VAGAVDVGTLTNNAAAVIQGGALVDAKDNVEVNAVSEQSLTGYVISGDGGAAAIGAAVSVWSLGSPLQTTYSDSNGNTTSTGNAVTNQNTGSGGNNADSNAATQSQDSTQQVTGSGGLGGLTTSGVTNQNSSAYRVNSATSDAGGMVNSAAPTSSEILAMQSAPPAGTTAEIDYATVNAGHNIGVTATDSFTVTQILGQVGIGVVAAGAAVDILTVAENVTAEAGGTLSAGGAITVNSNLQDHGTITALDLAGGFVALGAAVVVVNDSSATQASLLDYTVVSSAASLSVTANAVVGYTLTTGQGAAGAVTAGATFTELNITGNVSATIGNEAQIGEGAGSVGAVTVSATESVDATLDTGVFNIGIASADLAFADITISSSVDAAIGGGTMIKSTGAVSVEATTPFITADAEVIGGTFGGLTLSGMLAQPTINGATQATIGSGGSITSAGLNVAANDEDTTAEATLTTMSAGAIAVSGAVAKAVINRNTKANVGTMTIVAAGHAVNIDATSNNSTTSTTQGVSAGAVSVSIQLSEADVNGETQASIGAGSNVTGALSVMANDTSMATPAAYVLGIGAYTGNGAVASSTLNRTVEAFIGNETGTTNPVSTFTMTGSATVDATSNETVNVTSQGAALGLIAVGISAPTAEIEGVTRAYVGPDTTVDATKGSVTLSATDTSNATIAATGWNVGGLTGGAVSPVATIARTTDAFIDTASGVMDATGSVSINATSNITASSSATGGGGGGLSIDAMIPTTTISGGSYAYLGQGDSVDASALTIAAGGKWTPSATASIINIGIGAGSGENAIALVTGSVDAYVGNNTTINVAGNVSVTATSVVSPASGNASIGSGGGIAVSVLQATVTVENTTEAYIGDTVAIVNAGSLNVVATETDDAVVTGSVFSIGFGDDRGVTTTATVDPTTSAFIGTGVVGIVAGNVNVTATSVRAEGNATANDSGGGVVDIGASNAVVNTNPTVSAYIGVLTSITAGGTVAVTANGESAASEPVSPYITNVNLGNNGNTPGTDGDTIVFNDNGLQTGDQVSYSPNGGAAIQTASGALGSLPRVYNVISVDPNTVALGNQFAAGALGLAGPFTSGSGVETLNNAIRFSIPDNFQTGDAVVYYDDGAPSIGLTNGGTYFVRTIDAYTIELYSTLAGAESAAASATPGDVSGSTIKAANNFTQNELVTYLPPAPIDFTAADVNITVNSSTGVSSPAPGANTILVGNNSGFQAGDEVVYTASGGASPITGLTSGDDYYVLTTGTAGQIQLAATSGGSAITISVASNATGTYALQRASIGGLVGGEAYYVVNPTSTSFQLATSPSGTAISLTAPGGSGGSFQFFQAGLALVPSTGTQELRIAFTSTGSLGQEELLTPDGLPLTAIQAPPGSGVSQASGTGGSGGGIEVGEPSSSVNSTFTISAAIDATYINAAQGVSITANSQPNLSSYASNGAGGFIQIGNANTTLSFTNQNSVSVGGGTTIVTGGAFSMDALDTLTLSADAHSTGGGFISSAHANATVNVNGTTTATVGSDASITASTVSILSELSSGNIVASSYAHAGGLFGDTDAESAVNGSPVAGVTINGGGTAIDGLLGVTIDALQFAGVSVNADSEFIGIGPSNSGAPDRINNSEYVTGLAGSTITASPPDSVAGPTDATQPLALYVVANGSLGGTDQHNITWNTNLNIYDSGSPTLVVNAAGDIVTATNITVNGGQSSGAITGNISVDNISDNGGPEVIFNSPGGSPDSITWNSSATEPTFKFIEGFQQVLITNESNKELIINNIDAYDTGTTLPKVEEYSSNVSNKFLLTQAQTPTLIDIQNLGTGAVLLQGDIENPIGETRILNTKGNILATATSIVVTNTLGNQFATLLPGETFHGIQATLGSIGTAANPVNVKLVQSAGRNEQLYAAAGGNVYLNLTGFLFGPPVSNFTVYVDSIVAGGTADVTLQTTLQGTGTGSSGGVEVTVPPNSKAGVFYQQFTYFNPDSPSGTLLDLGETVSGGVAIASTYDFIARNSSLGLTSSPGIIAGSSGAGDIIITSAHSAPTATTINVNAITSDLVPATTTGTGTISVLTNGYIVVTETTGNLRAELIKSTASDVTLTAADSILDGSGDPTGTEVYGNNITLTAQNGGIGTATDPLGIVSQYYMPGVLTASADLDNIYIVQTSGTVDLNYAVDPGLSVFLTALQGSILNGALPGTTYNVVGANGWLTAEQDIGTSCTDRIETEVGAIETDSITGDTYVNNVGDLTIGGSFETDSLGATSGGNLFIATAGAITVEKSVYAVGDTVIVAENSSVYGVGNIIVDSLDLAGNPLVVDGATTLSLLAGDNLTVQQGAAVQAGLSVFIKSDYQGDICGNTPTDVGPSQFVDVGTVILIAGIVASPFITIEGGDGPDKITAASTSVLDGAYPWTPATFPKVLGTFPRVTSTESLIVIFGDNGAVTNYSPGVPETISSAGTGAGGNDTINVVGTAYAQGIDIFGGDGSDTINLTPISTLSKTDTLVGTDIIFGDNGTIDLAASGQLETVMSAYDSGGGNDTITVGPANDAIIFGGEGSNRITTGAGAGIIFGNEGEIQYSPAGVLSQVFSTNAIINEAGAPGFVTGNNIITVGSGDFDVLAGIGKETVNVGNGNNIIIGHDGELSYTGGILTSVVSIDPAEGGTATITMGTGNNTVIGGFGPNKISATGGNQIIVGHDGQVLYSATGVLQSVASIDPQDAGGNNIISGGPGNDLIIGGIGNNTITVGNGESSIIGQDGEFLFDANGNMVEAETVDAAYSGKDKISVGAGADVILGGSGSDTITAAAGNQIIIGDNGSVTYSAPGILTAVIGQDVFPTSNSSVAYGGSNTINVAGGDNLIIGGFGNNLITVTTGGNTIIGQDGEFLFTTGGQLILAETLSPAEGGKDTISLSNGNNVVLGGTGNDTITAGTGNQVIVGDNGAVSYSVPGVLEYVIGQDVYQSGEATVTATGSNAITLGAGNDFIIGGHGANRITAGNGNSAVIGQDGEFLFTTGGQLILAETINPALGGADTIALSTGNYVVLGGTGSDKITTGVGNQVIVGNNGTVAYSSPGVLAYISGNDVYQVGKATRVATGNNIITVGDGNDFIIGGIGNQTITGGTGVIVAIGEDGLIGFSDGLLIYASSENPAYGGNSTISVGLGPDILIGGTGNDTITTSGNDYVTPTDNNIIIGDNGFVGFTEPGVLSVISTSNPNDGGSNKITTGNGNNFILGGIGNNTITAGWGNNVVIGEDGMLVFSNTSTTAAQDTLTVGSQDWLSQGRNAANGSIWNEYEGWYTVTYTGGLLTYATSLDPTYGGNNSITLGNGTDAVIGGTGNDTITLGNGSDIVIGDNGNITWTPLGTLTTIQTSDPTDAGNNTITVGLGNDFILGGAGSDTIIAGVGTLAAMSLTPCGCEPQVHPVFGNDVIVGDDGVISFSASIWDWVNPTWFAEYGAPLLSVTSTDLTYGGNDTITGGPGNQVAIGGFGADTITLTNVINAANSGVSTYPIGEPIDIAIGDSGQVNYLTGGALSEIQSVDQTQAETGNDTITVRGAETYVIGGAGNDTINAGDGNNAIIGDEGAMYFTAWCQRPQDDPAWISFQDAILYEMNSTSPSLLGSNVITAGQGENAIIGGSGSNIITAGDGGNTVIGGNGYISFLAPGVDGTVESIDPSYDGDNTISTGAGNDRIIGGPNADKITDSGGSNVIFGGDAILTFVDDYIEGDSTLLAFSGFSYAGTNGFTIYGVGLLASAVSTDTTTDGTDTITAGDGQNLIVGGSGSNTITAGNGQDIIVGNNAQIGFAGAGELQIVQSTAPVPLPGVTVDQITVGDGNDIIIGGIGNNTIKGGNGSDIVFGADGEVTFTNFVRSSVEGQPWDAVEDTVLAEAQSNYLTLSGADTITLGSGNDVVIGGSGNDTITLAAGNPGGSYVVIGGDGQVIFSTGGWVTSASIVFPQLTGTDVITIGSAQAVVLSGANDEVISNVQNPIPQMASGPAPTGQDTSAGLTQTELAPVVVEAEQIWARMLGPDSARLAILNGITASVSDLPGGMIGATIGDSIYIDSTADGWGWFIDPTAAGNADFQATTTPGVLTAVPGSVAAGHMDLLSTVLHEIGNALGYPEDSGPAVTDNVLTPGTRRLPLPSIGAEATAGPPTINWATTQIADANALGQGDPDGSSWVDSFLNYPGQGKAHRPNANLRIKLPG